MKIKLNTPILEVTTNVIELANSLSNADNTEQAKFFNSFGDSLLSACDTKFKKEMQICTIVDMLDDKGLAFFKQVTGFIEISNK